MVHEAMITFAVQKQVEAYWNAKPCDSEFTAIQGLTPEFFSAVEAERYRLQWHIPRLLDQFSWVGKRVLEIGTGVGTDARALIRRGASYTGINIDAGSTATTSATREIRRVLKPGGEVLAMVYNRRSINYAVEIRLLRKLAMQLLRFPGCVDLLARVGFPRDKLERHRALAQSASRMSDEEWLARNTDGPDNPYSNVYDEEETAVLFAGFDVIGQQRSEERRVGKECRSRWSADQ